MRVEINNHVKTFRFPSEELIYFGQTHKINKLYDEDVMIYCSFGSTVYEPKGIHLVRNYGSFNKIVMEVHPTVIDMYVILIADLFKNKKLLIMDGQTGEFIKYTENVPLEKLIIEEEKKVKFCFLDLFFWR